MTLEQHGPEIQRASNATAQSHSLRSRLLRELDELEDNLQTARELVAGLPVEDDAPIIVSETETKVRKTWHLWKH